MATLLSPLDDLMTGDSTLGFEAALEQLEATVRELEGGELGLDNALSRYEQGVRLLTRCFGLLNQAERRVELLVGRDEAGKPILEPFDEVATVTKERPTTPKVRASYSLEVVGTPLADDDIPF